MSVGRKQLSSQRRRLREIRGQPADSLGEGLGLGEEREDEKVLRREVEEISGMDEYSGLGEQIQDQLLVADRPADTKHRRPASLGLQQLGRRRAGHRRTERRKIVPNLPEDRGANARRNLQRPRKSPLDRRGHREIT